MTLSSVANREPIDVTFMNIARAIANRSYATKRKVGAIAVKDGNVISMGYNGTPAGWDNRCEDENNKTYPHVIHAESNLVGKLAQSNVSSRNCVVYTTTAPCLGCSMQLYLAGVSRVVYDSDYKNDDGIHFLNKVGIGISKLGSMDN